MIQLVLAGPLTIAIYLIFVRVYRRHPSLATLPVLATSIVLIALVALPFGDLASYERGTAPLKFLLGPATLALAVPLARQRAMIARHRRALAAVVVGAGVGAASAGGLSRALGLRPALVATLAPKSVTTPMAMPIAERIGGIPALTAAIVILVGVLGMAVGPYLLDRFGVRSPVARGLALGTSAHGVGTARALSESDTTGAAAGVAMVVAGIVTALVVPLLVG
jgi:predicted murein hydrolase (TIGR00659 family)